MAVGDYPKDRPTITSTTAIIRALDAPEKGQRMPCLVYLSGLDAGKLLALNMEAGPILIGRDEDCDIRIDSAEVSRHHASIELEGEVLYLVDLGSKNRVYVNDEPVQKAPLKADDKIRIGPYVMLRLTYQHDEEIRLSRELYNRAVSDPLTGIVNREFFLSTLKREWSFARRHQQIMALAIADLDHFKQVNDRFGHLAGDEVLRQFVDRVAKHTRLEDLLGRYGGEEFILLLRQTDATGARKVAERIRSSVESAPFLAFGNHVPVTVSIGLATYNSEEMELHTPEELVRQADEALYRAKAGGRNSVRT